MAILTANFHLVAIGRCWQLSPRSQIGLLFVFADVFVFALHGNPLDLSFSSSLDHAANLAYWAGKCIITVSDVVLLQAESEVFPVAFPTSGRRRQSSSRKEGGFCCVRVEQSSRVFGIVVVDFLSGSKSQNSHSEKFHFFTSFGFEVGI